MTRVISRAATHQDGLGDGVAVEVGVQSTRNVRP